MSSLHLLFLQAEEALSVEALVASLRAAGHLVDLAPPPPLEAAEKRHIAVTLQHTRGNKRQAAHLLGIARSTLLAKVRKYEL